MNDYQIQDLLASLAASMEIKFLKTGKHFEDDKDERDIYTVTIKRGSRSYTFNFGQSINASGEYVFAKHLQNKVYKENLFPANRLFMSEAEYNRIKPKLQLPTDVVKNPNYSAPDEYSVLAALTKYDPGTLEDFCGEFGYDTDSKKAEKTYNAIREEYMNMCALFNDDELEQLREIQ